MSDHMKEAERLIECLRCSMTAGSWDEYRAALLDHIQRGAPEGWKEATIAWEVCASIHREYAKKKDPFFTTRQADFVRHTEAARATLLDHIQRRAVPDGWQVVPKEPDIKAHLLYCSAPKTAFRTVWKDGIDVEVPAHWVEHFCRRYGDAREAAGYARGLAEAGDRIRRGRKILDAALRGEVKP